MISKSLFFKMMRENTKQRLWLVALISLCFFFLFPVQTALSINGYLSPENLQRSYEGADAIRMARKALSEDFMHSCAVKNGFMAALLIALSAVCGLSGFSYLHSKKKVDFYHSLPLRRELLFFVILLNGFLYTAVPYAVCMVISAVMLQIKAVEVLWGQMLLSYLMHMAFYFLLYVTAAAAALMTGNMIVSGLGTLVFYLWGPGVTLLFGGYFQTYFKTWYNNEGMMTWWMKHSSPAAWYVFAVDSKTPDSMALWAVLTGAVILGITVFLYRKRPSEAAGRAMAFKISQPVIRFLLAVPFSLWGGIVFFSLTHRDSWAIFGLLCGLILSSCVIEIIYNFDFKSLFAHKRQLLGCAVCSAVFFVFFRFDLGGYDSYLPSAEKVESAGIYCDNLESNILDRYHVKPRPLGEYSRQVEWQYGRIEEIVDMMELPDTETALAIAGSGISDVARNRQYMFSGNWWEDTRYSDSEKDQWGRIVIAYHLKNGKTVYRSYHMNLSAVAAELDAVYDMDEYKTAVYPVLSYDPEEIAGINYQEYGDFSHVALKSDEIKTQLLLTYQKELRALKAQTRKAESPVAAIQFKSREIQELIDVLREREGNYEAFNHRLYFPIYPSFTETIALLKQCGIRVGSILTGDTVEKIVLEYRGNFSEELKADGLEYKAEIITDKKRIREILDSAISCDLNVSDDLNAYYWGISVKAYIPLTREDHALQTDDTDSFEPETADWKREESDTEYKVCDFWFDEDQIPEFVKEMFHLTDEMVEEESSRAY